MANPQHVAVLKKGVQAWNDWRQQNYDLIPDLSDEDLSGLDLSGAILSGAILFDANLSNTSLVEAQMNETNLTNAKLMNANLTRAEMIGAYLEEAELSEAILDEANLSKAWASDANFYNSNLDQAYLEGASLYRVNFTDASLKEAHLSGSQLSETILEGADLRKADLRSCILNNANLRKANLEEAKLSGVNLSGADLAESTLVQADLSQAIFIETNLTSALFDKVTIYGISVWDIKGIPALQKDLVITPPNKPEITVDDIEVAQFIYLLLNNKKVRGVIQTITSKAVLILGRFKRERKVILDALRDALRGKNYLPILFDFEGSKNRDITETIQTLAGMSRFVIADITEAKSIPQELSHIVPNFPSVPVIPLILKSQRPYAMFGHWTRFPWVLDIYEYQSKEELISNLDKDVILPLEEKATEQIGS